MVKSKLNKGMPFNNTDWIDSDGNKVTDFVWESVSDKVTLLSTSKRKFIYMMFSVSGLPIRQNGRIYQTTYNQITPTVCMQQIN